LLSAHSRKPPCGARGIVLPRSDTLPWGQVQKLPVLFIVGPLLGVAGFGAPHEPERQIQAQKNRQTYDHPGVIHCDLQPAVW
jgi:hypothetical protein